MAWLTDLLDANQITYGQASTGMKTRGLDYRSMQKTWVSVNEGDLVIDAKQAHSSLLQV